MPLNQSLEGKEYQEVSFEVRREDVDAFAAAIGERAAVFTDAAGAREAGYPEQVAPPTFIAKMQMFTSGQVVLDRELGLNYMLVVHGEQEYEWRRPLVVGDVVSTTPRIARIYSRGPNEFLVIEADVRDAAGETVVVARTTLLSRGTAAA